MAELTPEEVKGAAWRYVRTLIAADMMGIQTGYPMTKLHIATIGAFRMLPEERQQALLRKLEVSLDEIITDAFDEIMLKELRK